MKRNTITILFLLLIAGCCSEEDIEVSGKQPVYISYTHLLQYEQQPPQPVVNAGKVMVYSNYLFLGEVNKGIHIIDISDTINPQKISFLKIPGNKDMVAQSARLYADNGPHLLILDLSDINHITLIKREENWFQPSEYFPAEYNGYFVCADYTKGWVTGWVNSTLQNPECNR